MPTAPTDPAWPARPRGTGPQVQAGPSPPRVENVVEPLRDLWRRPFLPAGQLREVARVARDTTCCLTQGDLLPGQQTPQLMPEVCHSRGYQSRAVTAAVRCLLPSRGSGQRASSSNLRRIAAWLPVITLVRAGGATACVSPFGEGEARPWRHGDESRIPAHGRKIWRSSPPGLAASGSRSPWSPHRESGRTCTSPTG